MEQCREFQTHLFVNYVDFKKAFDSIHRESLRKILKLYGNPDKFINIFKSLYHGTTIPIAVSRHAMVSPVCSMSSLACVKAASFHPCCS